MSCQTCNAGPMLGPQRVRSWLYQPTHVPLTPQESGNCKSKDLSHGENHSNSWSNTSNSSNLHLNSLIQKSPPKKLFNDLSFNSPILYIYIYVIQLPRTKKILWLHGAAPLSPKLEIHRAVARPTFAPPSTSSPGSDEGASSFSPRRDS